MKFSNDALVEQIKPAVREKIEFEFRDDSKLFPFRILGLYGFLCKKKEMDNFPSK